MKRIFIPTLSRSDYSSLKPIMRTISDDPRLTLQIIAGGSHMISRYGHTIDQIRLDGLTVTAIADFLFETDDTPRDLAQAYARAVKQFVHLLEDQEPDLVFVLGDRWEMLAVASAAAMLNLPIVHHSGGDVTQGSTDNQTRNALTALAHMHLVALPEHRERLLRMGEEDWRIITTGEPALTQLGEFAAAVPDVNVRLSLPNDEAFVLATFHPTSFEPTEPDTQIEVFLAALEHIKHHIVLTAPNPDSSSRLFFERQKAFAAQRPNVHFFESLGAELYYAAMNRALFMIGNSSSGLWEAPSFKLPAINIGTRQAGRIHGRNVINVPLDLKAIVQAITTAQSPSFNALIGENANPYVRPNTLTLIVDSLLMPIDRATLLAKRFVDPFKVS